MLPPDRSRSPVLGPPSLDPERGTYAAAPAYLPAPRLWRSRSNRLVAGVLGGLAEKFGWEPRPVRLLYGLLGLLTLPLAGLPAILPYLGLWSITRALGLSAAPGPRLWRSRSNVVVAGVLGGVAERLGVAPTFVRVLYGGLTVVSMGVPGVVTYLVLWACTRPLDAPAARNSSGTYGVADA